MYANCLNLICKKEKVPQRLYTIEKVCTSMAAIISGIPYTKGSVLSLPTRSGR